GGAVYIGATGDTDPGITYSGYPVKIKGARQGLLPLRLLSFKAKKSGIQDASLSWVTTNEENTSHFIVQHSWDLKSWTNISSVAAAGYSLGLEQYNFMDAEVYNGLDSRLTAYYRLDMVDLDGRSKLSPIESVVFGTGISSGREMTVYPNPASDGILVEWDANTPDPPTSLEFYDLYGKLIYTQHIEEQTNQKYIDFSKTLQPGLYMLRMINEHVPIDYKSIVIGHRQ
ncbi:MAG: T9SS type A sorting domain-containing protein, partial [Saprospiraceae bacterium]